MNRAKQVVWSYALPFICLFGILSHSTNVLVFKSKQLKSNIYSYFLIHSIAELVYVLICFIYFLLKSNMLPSHLHYSYLTKQFELYAYLYFSTVVALFMISLELTISIRRLLMVLNYNLGSSISKLISLRALLVTYFSVAAFVQAPFLFSRDIISQTCHPKTGSQVCYEVIVNRFGKGDMFKSCYSILNIYRGAIMPGMLLIINSLMLIKYKNQIRKKNSMSLRMLLASSAKSESFIYFFFTCKSSFLYPVET